MNLNVQVTFALVGLFLCSKVSTFRTSNWLAITARFGIAGYTLLLWASVSFFDRNSFLAIVLNKFGVGYPLPEKDYGDVCQIYAPNHPSGDPFFNVTDRVDIFVIAHSLGWFAKALIVRDLGVSWVCSVLFELIELAFAHMLPNFRECWWDSIILDVFGCNLVGIYLADYILSQLGWKKYNFLSSSFGSKRINYKFLFTASLLVALITLIDMNFFFLKFVLYIPTTHWLSHVRTYMFALISVPASMEMYKWAAKPTGRKVKKTNSSRWTFFTQCPSAVVGMAGLMSEIVLFVTFRGNMFRSASSTPLATHVLILSLVYVALHSFVKI